MFSAKITAGRALGLYDEQVEDDLNRIRKIRNEFAHALLSISFENEVIIGICNSIADYVYHVERQRTQINKARLKFERACWTISLGLMIQTNERLEKRTADLQSIITNALSKAWRIPDMNTIVTARLKGAMNDIKSDLGPQKIF